MEFGISTKIFSNGPLSTQLLDTLTGAGFRHIELFCNRPHMDFRDAAALREIARWFSDRDLPPPSLHLPFLERDGFSLRQISALDPERRRREEALDEFKRALEICDQTPVRHAVLHLGVPGQAFSPVLFDYAYSAIQAIRGFAGVRVLLENIPNEVSTVARLNDFIDSAQAGDTAICYDTGHGRLQGPVERFDRITALHMHDNHGENDEHLWPFEGTLNWPALVDRLVTTKFSGPLLFETSDSEPEKGREASERIEELWVEASTSIEEFRLKHSLEGGV